MSVLVVYASKHGATSRIAERIGDTLRARGVVAEVRPVNGVTEVDEYEAFVVGCAVYFGSWLNEMTSFLEPYQTVLATHAVWLFSSGPLGDQPTDAKGRDLRDTSVPKELGSVARTVHARDHRVFFGALDHTKFGVCERLLWTLPASRKLLIEGDFCNWDDIEGWAASIADQLAHESSRIPTASAGSPDR